jgi:hypothetical protein
MYVANSEPTEWLRGGGRAGVRERVLISGEPNRGEVGRDMERRCDLTRGSPPVLVLIISGRRTKPLRGRKKDWYEARNPSVTGLGESLRSGFSCVKYGA